MVHRRRCGAFPTSILQLNIDDVCHLTGVATEALAKPVAHVGSATRPESGRDRTVTVVNLARRANSVAFTPSAAKPLTRRSGAARLTQGRAIGRWWLAGCSVARAVGWRCEFPGRPPARSRCATGVASRRPASKSIETICVGQRVVTQDAGNWAGRTGTAVNPQTWKLVAAETHWGDGTCDAKKGARGRG